MVIRLSGVVFLVVFEDAEDIKQQRDEGMSTARNVPWKRVDGCGMR